MICVREGERGRGSERPTAIDRRREERRIERGLYKSATCMNARVGYVCMRRVHVHTDSVERGEKQRCRETVCARAEHT